MSDRVRDALAAARARGCAIVVASGRPFPMIPGQLRDPHLVSCLLCCNGAVVCDVSGAPLMERGLSQETAVAVLNLLEPLHPAWNAFLPGGAFFEWGCFSYMLAEPVGEGAPEADAPSVRQALRRGRAAVRRARAAARRLYDDRHSTVRVRSVAPLVREASLVYKLGCTLPSPQACDRALELLAGVPSLEVARVSPVELELTASGADKGAAGLWIERQLGCGPTQAVGFGDSENDLPLRAACSTFVAMGNAPEHVRDAADEVCEPVWEDGVACWIERELLAD